MNIVVISSAGHTTCLNRAPIGHTVYVNRLAISYILQHGNKEEKERMLGITPAYLGTLSSSVIRASETVASTLSRQPFCLKDEL
jgi:hypothetical protein